MPRREQRYKTVAVVSRFLLEETIDKIGNAIFEDVCRDAPVDIHRDTLKSFRSY